MTVGELIELLEQQPKDVDILIECRSLDYAVAYLQDNWYPDGTPVVHLNI